MILDPSFLKTILWHSIKATNICLIFVTISSDSENSIKKYSFTLPIQRALFKIYNYANDLDVIGTQIHTAFCTSDIEVAYWVRTFADQCRHDILPSSRDTSILNSYPMFNPYNSEIALGICGMEIFQMDMDELVEKLGNWIDRERLEWFYVLINTCF